MSLLWRAQSQVKLRNHKNLQQNAHQSLEATQLLPNYLLWKPSIIITGIHIIGFDKAQPCSNIYTIETERVWSGELSHHKL